MLGIKKIIEYLHDAEEINSFEECYEIDFPKGVTLEEQIQFVKEVEDASYINPIELDEKQVRHILYYLLLAQLELNNIMKDNIK